MTAGSSSTLNLKQRVRLNDEDLLVTQPNYQVIHLEAYSSINKQGKPYLVFCHSDNLRPAKGSPVCLYQNIWHKLLTNKKGAAAVGEPIPSIHNYDRNKPIKELTDALKDKTPQKLILKPVTQKEEDPTSLASTISAIFTMQATQL